MKRILICLGIPFICSVAYSQQSITVTSKPSRQLIETGDHKQILNVDFLVANAGADTVTLAKISLDVFDQYNNLVHARFLDNNGTAPSIDAVPNRILNGSMTRLFFNPFTEFSSSLPLNKLVYKFTFENNAGRKAIITSVLHPELYKQETSYLFPMKGKVLVYDAHDVASHHRRFDYEFEPIKALGFQSNFMRYAYDFVLMDSGRQFKTDGKMDEDYFGWAAPVYAVAAGRVIAASRSHNDDHQFDIPSLAKNPMALYGNFIAIRHRDSSVSIYAHLRQNSPRVKEGDTIAMGQEIGAIGASGSSFFPHLHFEIRTDLTHKAEGLPSYFSNVQVVEGRKKITLKSGLVETGSIIEAR